MRFIRVFLILMMVLGGVLITPGYAQTCTAPNWEGRFYNSTDLTGSQVYSTCAPVLDFSWGTGAPAGGVNFDNFSVRWTGTQTFPSAGTYQFAVTVEDGARLFINGSPIINSMTDAESPRTLTANYEVSAPGSTAFITLEAVNFVGNAQLKLAWSLVSGGNAPQNTTNPGANTQTQGSSGQAITFGQSPTGGGQSWLVEYFNNPNLEGNALYFESAPADGIGRNYDVNAPTELMQADGWSARWSRVVDFPADTYTFTLRADDGAVVRINNTQILNYPNSEPNATYSVNVEIPAGRHSIVVEHFDATGTANLFLTWNPPVGTTLFQDGCNSEVAGINGNAAPCPERVMTTSAPVASTNMSVTVAAGPLNFRPAPAQSALPIQTISRGEQYTAVGRSADNIWIQLQVNGVTGWAMSEFLTLSGDINALAVTDNSGSASPESATDAPETLAPVQPPALASVQAVARGYMRIRDIPNQSGTRIGSVPWGEQVGVMGRSRDGQWLLIQHQGVTGWSSRAWYEIVTGSYDGLPISN